MGAKDGIGRGPQAPRGLARPTGGGSRRAAGRPGRPRLRRLAVTAATALLAATLATAAQAQLPGLGLEGTLEELGRATGTGEHLDTDYTPHAKQDAGYFTQVAGAPFGRTRAVGGSATSFATDLYTVDFRNTRRGFAAGAETIECETETGEKLKRRVPAIYAYLEGDNVVAGWQESHRGDCADPGGYVGAVAWIGDQDRALAVGGSGDYPKREPAFDPGAQDLEAGQPYGLKNDPAGEGRAWLYDPATFKDRAWHELRDLPEGMRGMTALDFYVRSGPAEEWGEAGALGQIWRWQRKGPAEPGRFSFESSGEFQTGEGRPGQRIDLRFRVRDIEFTQPYLYGYTPHWRQAWAVTAGCCAKSPLHNRPRVLANAGGGWSVNDLRGQYAERFTLACTSLFVTACADVPPREASTPGALGVPPQKVSVPQNPADDPDRRPRPDMPDSFYSLTAWDWGAVRAKVSVIASPGGPPDPNLERPSTVSQPYCLDASGAYADPRILFDIVGSWDGAPQTHAAVEALRTSLSSARLVAGDGDIASSYGIVGFTDNPTRYHESRGLALRPSSFSHNTISCSQIFAYEHPFRSGSGLYPDGVPDWAVGELRSRRDEHGAQGLALATALNAQLLPETVNQHYYKEPRLNLQDPAEDPTKADRAIEGLTSKEKLLAYSRSRYFLLPSYALNAIDVIGQSGAGWAVGERGAILRLGEGAALGQSRVEPAPPSLGAPATAKPPERAPYEAHRPPPGAAGAVVPPLAEAARRLAAPRLASGGSPDQSLDGARIGGASDDLGQVAISRDGRRGWAIGGSATGLYRYDGSAWSVCELGLDGRLEPDPACAELGPLRDYKRIPWNKSDPEPAPVGLLAVARVPLEHDPDPTNDERFELLATGGLYREAPEAAELPAVLRYREGRWALATDDASKRLRELLMDLHTFTSVPRPERGAHRLVLAAPDDGFLFDDDGELLRLDKKGWRRCEDSPSCDPGGLLSGVDLASAKLSFAAGRIYLTGSRAVSEAIGPRSYPVVLHRGPGQDAWSADPGQGGYDPGRDPERGASERGSIAALSIARRPDGRLEGWAVGSFGGGDAATSLLYLEPGGRWGAFRDPGIFAQAAAPSRAALILPGRGAASEAFIAGGPESDIRTPGTSDAIYRFDPARRRWRPLPGQPNATRGTFAIDVRVRALLADGEGGFWAAVGHVGIGSSGYSTAYFLHYTDRAPLFEETASPLRRPEEGLTALAATPEGTLWAAGTGDTIYRYDRLTGWDRTEIPGWEPPRTTLGHPARAIALGPEGRGLVVGAEGRIANLSAEGIALDPAAGSICQPQAPLPPCGTSRDLRAAAIAPDGSALVGGEHLALLWRPPGGEFRAVSGPREAAANATVAGIAMPSPDRAWIALATGLIFAGQLQGGDWSWKLENLTPDGTVVPLDEGGSQIPLRAIAIDRSGHGYAVGDRGVILRRTGDREQPWRRLTAPSRDDLTAVALAADGGPGVLIGGRSGLVLSGEGERFGVARPADYAFGRSQYRTGPVIGLALLPGPAPGQAEAWAATELGTRATHTNSGQSQLFHYASDPGEPLLNPERRARPLPDVPAPRPGELSLAVLGNSSGPVGAGVSRPEALLGRTVEELAARAREAGGPDLAIFSGDALAASGDGPELQSASAGHLEWARSVIDPLTDAGLPLYAALGRRDLSELPSGCAPNSPLHSLRGVFYGDTACDVVEVAAEGVRRSAKLGENFAWRKAMAAQPRPWGSAAPPRLRSLALRPLDGEQPLAPRERDADPGVSDLGPATEADQQLDGTCLQVIGSSSGCKTLGYDDLNRNREQATGSAEARIALDGARTHYAFDLIDTSREREREVARIVVADNSNRSLAASDPFQQPLEAKGGQTTWLEEMLCVRGRDQSATAECTRRPNQPAIVVATTPTYSYAATPPDETATDAAAFEALLMRYGANLVLSGRLGWNGLYWATAPGLHEPCPGGTHQTETPKPNSRACGGSEAAAVDPGEPNPASERLAESLRGAGAPPPPGLEEATGGVNRSGVLPFVVAAGAGGPLGAQGADAGAARGFWSGYTIARLDRSGDPRALIVEQRPLLDWIAIDGPSHVLLPGQRLALRGTGREPMGISGGRLMEVRYDPIADAAITHRYDLVEAGPEKPWVPRTDADGSYLALDPAVGVIDAQSGKVKAGKGKRARTFAIAILSVGDRVATYPLVFEPRKSFTPKPVEPLALPSRPRPAPPVPEPIRVLSAAGATPPIPQPPPSQPPPAVPPQLASPPPPALPGLPPPPVAEATAPPLPPPPALPQPVALNVSPTIQTVSVAPVVFPVLPPPVSSPVPPVQPAPPQAARRKKVAIATSSQQGERSEVQELGGDLAIGRDSPDQAFRRHDRARPAPSFTTVARPDQPSAWARGALYGGGLTIMSLALALGLSGVRPTPRRRPPTVPAPAQAQAWHRRG